MTQLYNYILQRFFYPRGFFRTINKIVKSDYVATLQVTLGGGEWAERTTSGFLSEALPSGSSDPSGHVIWPPGHHRVDLHLSSHFFHHHRSLWIQNSKVIVKFFFIELTNITPYFIQTKGIVRKSIYRITIVWNLTWKFIVYIEKIQIVNSFYSRFLSFICTSKDSLDDDGYLPVL